MDTLQTSWNSFSSPYAHGYLKTIGYPSLNSKKMLIDVLKKLAQGKKIKILDIGCGNAQLYEYFKEYSLNCDYTGIDFSKPLLTVAQKNNPEAQFILDDVNQLQKVKGKYDIAFYSHVIEMVSSPEGSLLAAKQKAKMIIIRFFEPPEFESSFVELRKMNVDDDKTVPYIRWKLSKSYYKLMLQRLEYKKLEILQDPYSKDQIHIIQY